jgi:aspartate aminotransferase-like enzyme
MLGPRALEAMKGVRSSSFACDLGTWLGIMQAYEAGGHAYHATMPTDGLIAFRDVMQETVGHGLDVVRDGQQMLGDSVRSLLAEKGFASVAAPGYESPGVVVCYTSDPDLATGKKFAEQGLQIAAGVPLACDEPADFRTFRLGLFGLDKVLNRDRTVAKLRAAIDAMAAPD